MVHVCTIINFIQVPYLSESDELIYYTKYTGTSTRSLRSLWILMRLMSVVDIATATIPTGSTTAATTNDDDEAP